MTKVKQPTDIVRLRQIDSAATDEEVTKRIFDILGWEIFEYKDAIVEWDENEEEIIVEIPFYGVKMTDGTRYYKGTPFVEEIYEYVNACSHGFLPIMLDYISKMDNCMLNISVLQGASCVMYMPQPYFFNSTIMCPDLKSLPRAVAELLIQASDYIQDYKKKAEAEGVSYSQN